MATKTKPNRGRPTTRVIKINGSPEEIAEAIFVGAKPPDPSKRRKRKQ